MEFLRKKRRLAALGVVGAAFAAATLLVVLPAFAASGSAFAGVKSGDNVTPKFLLSGGENDCALFAGGGGTVGNNQYFASNPGAIKGIPQTLTASNGAKVTLTVTVDKTNTFLGFSVSGGIVTDVGIKGGNGTDWYNYELQPGGGVSGDTGLTAPAKSAAGQPPLYSLSQTVFCYTPKITCQANVPLSDPQNPGATIELPSCAGKSNVFFNFNSGQANNGNFVSVYAYGGSGTATTPLVEKVAGTLSGDTQPTLQYSDTNPAGTLHDMRLCQLDPRAGGADPLALATAYQDIGTQSSVLPPPSAADPEDSSCLISERTWVDAAGVVHFEAYVYSTIDGYEFF